MNPVLGSIIRSVLIAAGSYLVTHYHVDQSTVDAAVNGGYAIGGAVAVGGAAIWSLVRGIKAHMANQGV